MRLDFYFARRFLWSFLMIFSVFLGIVILIDMVEQLRRFDQDTVGLSEALHLSLLNAPASLYQMMPLLVILATITLFLSLSRSSEMVVTRAAGRSALRATMSPVLTVLLLGLLAISAFNPIVAATSQQYETVSNRYASGVSSSVTSVIDEGVWLRQAGTRGQVVIRAERSNLNGTRFFDVTFYGFNQDGSARDRIEADEAQLQPGSWTLSNAKRWTFEEGTNSEAGSTRHSTWFVASDLTQEQIQDSFGTPQAIPIWELPRFIRQLDRAGFSALQHRVWLQMEIAKPILLAAMVLIGAGFTVRHTRFGRTGLMVLFAILLGFSVFFLRNFAQVLGENGQIPILVAAWAPPLAGIFLSLGLLLHTEDG